MPDFFNEEVMNSKLNVFIHEGEHLIAGVGNGMPHHAENRDKIIEKLNSLSK